MTRSDRSRSGGQPSARHGLPSPIRMGKSSPARGTEPASVWSVSQHAKGSAQAFVGTLGQVDSDPTNREGTDPAGALSIEPTPSSTFRLAVPAKLGPTLEINAESPPLDDLDKSVAPADLWPVEHKVRTRISTEDRKGELELVGHGPHVRPARLLTFQGERSTQPAGITKDFQR